MSRTVSPSTLAALALAAAPFAHAAGPPSPGAIEVSGPVTHANLAVFLLHGAAERTLPPLVTLQEAMDRRLVVVHETGSVNELAVENLSPTLAIFIHAGDIVKGGRQDRTIPQDVLLPPASGRVPLASFCVEHGRWSARGAEPAAAFASSEDMLAGNGLKLASRKAADQSQVWQQVTRAQEALSRRAGAPVASPESPSSLQLTLQSPRVRQTAEAYVRSLAGAPASRRDVIGCAFVVNGEIRSAEVYASPELFRRMWPKLLRSAAVEAMAGGEPTGKVPGKAELKAFLDAAAGAPAEGRDLSERERLVTRETPKTVVFETLDKARKDAVVHRSWLAK